MRSIITEENDGDSEAAEDFDGSFASLRIADLNEMDATAHAGNVSHAPVRASGVVSATSHYPASPQRSTAPSLLRLHQYPSSPQRSSAPSLPGFHQYPSSPQRRFRGDSSYAGSSITSRGSTRYRRQGANFDNSYNASHEPSLSTLGDEDDEDDDNLEIIKLLRTQIDGLKTQLLDQQQQNNDLQHGKLLTKSDQSVHSSSCFGHDYSDCDSFGEEKDKDDASVGSLSSKGSSMRLSLGKKVADAETAVFGSVAALKASFRQQQEKNEQAAAAQPVPEPAADDTNLLMDELVLWELEAHAKVLQRVVNVQHRLLLSEREALQTRTEQQAGRIAYLERQLLEGQQQSL